MALNTRDLLRMATLMEWGSLCTQMAPNMRGIGETEILTDGALSLSKTGVAMKEIGAMASIMAKVHM
jgi:hypothetical protein